MSHLNAKVDLVMESALKPAIGKLIFQRSSMSKEQELPDHLHDIIIAITDIEELTHCMSCELFSGDKKTKRPPMQ